MGGPRRQGSLAGTRQRCAPGTSAQGAAGRLIGPAGHRRRERDTDSWGRSSLASTADGSSDLAIIMPDKPPTCCLCSEKANSIFTEPTMDRCFQHGGELGERTAFGQGGRTASGQRESEKLKEEFVAFLPCGWNRRRFSHPCPAGCCSPTPCHDRAASVLKYRASPSHPRKSGPIWNMVLAFQQTVLVVCLFSLIKQAGGCYSIRPWARRACKY